jgi:hypothetical protein
MEIRTLRANEIECRIGTISEKGCSLLLYKDARVDMRLLDETFGAMNWKRSHEIIDGNLYCTISIWDADKKEWVSKQDVGTESNTEKEKGQASDSFKRAGFNWNIGRELYTSPFIWISPLAGEFEQKNGKYTTHTKFSVTEIGYNDQREINRLVIVDNKGNARFSMGSNTKVEKPKEAKQKPVQPQEELEKAYKEISDATSVDQLMRIYNKYPSLHTNKNFTENLTNKRKAIQSGL